MKTSIILGTGNYENVKTGNTVSITGDGGNAWGYYGPAYKKLAPRLETYLPYARGLEELKSIRTNLLEYTFRRKKLEEEYIRSYYEIRLKNLDVFELFQQLENRFGRDIILLCHEPVGEFCHRRLVADYIELRTGIYIPEIKVEGDGMIQGMFPTCYKKSLQKLMK